MSTLTQPLTARGRVWFAAPRRFRWELGGPPQTIAVRQPAEVLILYPRLKRAERYPLDAASAGPWKDAMALLDAGFPRSRAELDATFAIAALTETNGLHPLALQPKSAVARPACCSSRPSPSSPVSSPKATRTARPGPAGNSPRCAR